MFSESTATLPAERQLALSLQNLAASFLAIIALVVTHEFLLQTRSVLMPFVLSGFIVLATEPTVSLIHNILAGHVWPHRWCICCCGRRRRRKSILQSDNGSGSDGAESTGSSVRSWMHYSDEDETLPLYGGEPLQASLHWSFARMADGFMRFLAAILVLSSLLCILAIFVTLLIRGAMHMRENWEAYRVGVDHAIKWLDKITLQATRALGVKSTKTLNTIHRVQAMYNYILTKMQGSVELLVDEIVSVAYGGLTTLFIISLYVLFWLLRPLPMAGQAGNLVRSYIWKKTFVSLLYGFFVSLLFYVLHVDLALFFGMVSFFLNYVPEVGAFISIIIPIPIMLLDGRMKSPGATTVMGIMGQLFLKLLFNNVLEVKLVEQDREMSIHPVWVLLGLNYFGYVWGAIGMLISVPMLAMLKSAMISKIADPTTSAVALTWSEGMLNCLEGRPGRSRRRLALKGHQLDAARSIGQLATEDSITAQGASAPKRRPEAGNSAAAADSP